MMISLSFGVALNCFQENMFRVILGTYIYKMHGKNSHICVVKS